MVVGIEEERGHSRGTFERVGIGYTYMSSLDQTPFLDADDEIVKIV